MRMTAGILALWLAASGAAWAQTTVPPTPDPNSAPPDKIGPPLDQHPIIKPNDSAPLSKDLSKSGGVVHPSPTVDPGMTQQPPDPGPRSTPVIKPPPAGSGVAPK